MSQPDQRGAVLVIGSANMDLVLRVDSLPESGQTVLAHGSTWCPGGKGANQAVAASIGGAEVSMAGSTGADAHGTAIRSALMSSGVDTTLLRERSGSMTGIAVVTVAVSGENVIVVAPEANFAITSGEVDALSATIAAADILLLQMELPPPIVERAIEVAHRVSTRVVLNAAPAHHLPAATLAKVNVLVVNQSEAATLLRQPARIADGESDLLDAARRLTGMGPPTCVITAGPAGAAVHHDGSGRHLPARPATVVDTAGAGDAFVGALVASLACGHLMLDALDEALAAGARAVSQHGAQMVVPQHDNAHIEEEPPCV